jgi:pilus assembly protein CpaC
MTSPLGLPRLAFAGVALGLLGFAPGIRAQEASGAFPTHVDLDLGKGRLIHLTAPAAGVFVGDPRVADIQVKSPTLIYLAARGLGETTLMAVDDHDVTLANIEVQVGYDLTQLRADLRRMTPGGDIQVGTTNDALVLSGVAASAAEAETAKAIALRYAPDADHLMNLLRVDAPNQVNLRVRVVEVSRDIIKAFGINWNFADEAGKFVFGVATGVGGLGGSATSITTPVSGLSGVTNVLAGFQNGTFDLSAVIDALDSEGLVTVLAEPNLTAVSGASASFLAGGEYPIPVPQGLGQVTVQYKNYGVSLQSVATITDDGRIRLTVKPEVSQLSNTGAVTLNGATVPALTTRRVETTVDLASGQSFAIAGLIQNNVTHNLQKTPGLGNIGLLGALFRADQFQREQTELVIIVTPYIVRPSSHRLEVPTDGYVAPTDRARVLDGADYTRAPAPTSAGPATPGAAPSGPVQVGHP